MFKSCILVVQNMDVAAEFREIQRATQKSRGNGEM